jgi:hypothetical protein
MPQASAKPPQDNPKKQTSRTRIKYVPPSDEMIDRFARQLCEKLGQENPAFKADEVWTGFGNYLRIVATIAANRMNREQEEKNDQVLDSERE